MDILNTLINYDAERDADYKLVSLSNLGMNKFVLDRYPRSDYIQDLYKLGFNIYRKDRNGVWKDVDETKRN